MKYGTLNLGQIEALGNVLGGMDNIQGILRGAIQVTLKPSFPVWMELEIGGLSAEQLISLLQEKPTCLRDYERDAMRMPSFTTSAEKRMVKLARCEVRDLGFSTMPSTKQLQAALKQRGCLLCPAELGPHLRLQLPTQESGDSLWVMMEQISDFQGCPIVWRLNEEKPPYRLSNRAAAPDRKWELHNSIVFIPPPWEN